jgi:sigma-B regulation protein RsbU (phosphoserine phosphatase)
MRILIAEDDFTSRTMLAAILQKEGYEVAVTTNGAEVWQALQQPDASTLVILDWMMPAMNGLEVVRRVRARNDDRPPYIIMLTTKGEKADIIAGLEAGANDYLTKPFDAGELRARVEVGRRMVEMQAALAAKIEELREALEQIKALRGIVPICRHCKQIRDDQGYWNQVETYISRYSDAQFSHGICPECLEKYYSEFVEGDDESEKIQPKHA